jgi:hypothetical protein
MTTSSSAVTVMVLLGEIADNHAMLVEIDLGSQTMETTLELFTEQRHRRFGRTNPERMQLSYWEWMVRNSLNPYQALKHFGAQLDSINGPDWCFVQRYGMTSTELANNQTIYIGGEYEDWYDEEFCIYNDVIVWGPNDEVAIYGYPSSPLKYSI